MKRNNINLPQFINENGGPSKFAKKYNFDRVSVHQWATLKNIPSAKNMMKIFKDSKGRCTYQRMIEDFFTHKELKEILK